MKNGPYVDRSVDLGVEDFAASDFVVNISAETESVMR